MLITPIPGLGGSGPAGGATEETQLALLEEVEQKTEPADAQNIRPLDAGTDAVAIGAPLPAGDNALGRVDVERSLGAVSPGNSSTDALAEDAIFTGEWEEVKDYSTIAVNVFAAPASATDGLSFEWSSDGSNADLIETVTIPANAGRAFRLSPTARFFRLRYTNGDTAQTAFRLQTIYHPDQLAPISRPLDKDISEFSSALIVRAILAAQRAGGSDDYLNVQATNGGNLKVSIEEVEGPLPVDTGLDQPLTDTELRATPVPVRTAAPTTASLQSSPISGADLGDNTLVSGVGGQTIRVFALMVVFEAAVDVIVKCGATAKSGAMAFAGKGANITMGFTGEPHFVTEDGDDFLLNLSDAVAFGGTVWYTQS